MSVVAQAPKLEAQAVQASNTTKKPSAATDFELGTVQSKKFGILATFKAVAWSFFGVRKGIDHDADMANLDPKYVVLVALISCAAFVLFLLALVKLVLSN
jgi:Protein of unknown function (DUF2970)